MILFGIWNILASWCQQAQEHLDSPAASSGDSFPVPYKFFFSRYKNSQIEISSCWSGRWSLTLLTWSRYWNGISSMLRLLHFFNCISIVFRNLNVNINRLFALGLWLLAYISASNPRRSYLVDLPPLENNHYFSQKIRIVRPNISAWCLNSVFSTCTSSRYFLVRTDVLLWRQALYGTRYTISEVGNSNKRGSQVTSHNRWRALISAVKQLNNRTIGWNRPRDDFFVSLSCPVSVRRTGQEYSVFLRKCRLLWIPGYHSCSIRVLCTCILLHIQNN